MTLGYPKEVTPARIKPFSEDVRSRLENYQKENGLSQGALGRQLNVSSTAVSKYLAGKPEGNVEKLEAIAADVLKNAERSKLIAVTLFKTSVSESVSSAIETARKTNDFCLITGNAGIGKTCGIQLYVRGNPACIYITASVWARNARDIVRAIWSAVDIQKWSGSVKKTEYLVDRLRNSNRPLIIDNAHRLKVGGIEYLFDFHDATSIPIILVGNPEIISYLRRNDQHFSRVGLHKHITRLSRAPKAEQGDAPPEVVETIINQVAPSFSDCADLAGKVLANRGHARSLRKQLSLADEVASKESFRTDNPNDTNRAAFIHAHKHLIRDYEL